MTPRDQYETDRIAGVSPEWEELAEATRQAYERKAPRLCGAHLDDDTDPRFRDELARERERKRMARISRRGAA